MLRCNQTIECSAFESTSSNAGNSALNKLFQLDFPDASIFISTMTGRMTADVPTRENCLFNMQDFIPE